MQIKYAISIANSDASDTPQKYYKRASIEFISSALNLKTYFWHYAKERARVREHKSRVLARKYCNRNYLYALSLIIIIIIFRTSCKSGANKPHKASSYSMCIYGRTWSLAHIKESNMWVCRRHGSSTLHIMNMFRQFTHI